jgi:dihydrodipicolinate reductase
MSTILISVLIAIGALLIVGFLANRLGKFLYTVDTELREIHEDYTKDAPETQHICVVKGCTNEQLPFSKYCSECYNEKYPPFVEGE